MSIEELIKEAARKRMLFGKEITPEEATNIVEEGKERKQRRSRVEQAVEEMAGKAHTPGQSLRYAGLGAGAGLGLRALSAAIDPGLRGAAFKPRSMANAAITGAIYGGALPVARRLLDIEAAKRGAF